MAIIENLIRWYRQKILRKKLMKISIADDLRRFNDLEDEKQRFNKNCSICDKKLDIYSHKCPYCKKWHCYDHLLPESHKCPNPKSPYGLNIN